MTYGGILILFIIIGILITLISIIIMQNYNRKKVKISFKESMNLTELPVVTFYNGTNKLNFLLDTGSNLCVINSNSLKHLEYTKLNEIGHIHGMEGNITDVEYISMNFTHNEKLYTSKFQVVDMQEAFDNVKKESGVTIHGILGSKFFEEYKYVLDFKELIAYTK